jgi:aryl-alcohol dehydrogenase-like predicted oxidoreductase
MNLARYVSEQPPYNLLDRRIENELIPLAQRYQLAILPWSPLGGGVLAGRYAQGIPKTRARPAGAAPCATGSATRA